MKRDQLLMTSATCRSPSKSFLITLLWGLQSCHSFQLQPHHQSSSPTLLCSTKSSSTDNYQPFKFLQEFSHDNESSSQPNENSSNNGVEIWLDLRGTSLSPSTALELWELEQNDGYSNYIDDGSEEARKKKGTAPFTKCLVSNDITNNSNNSKSNTEQELNSNPIQILVDHHNNNEDPTTTQQKQSWGKTLRLQLNSQSTLPILPDPLPAMELVSRGQFVLLDTTGGWKKVEEEERLSFLLPLAELISSGALPAANGASGGIGFTCLTKNEVVKVAMWIQSITNNNQCVNGADGDGGSIQNVRVKTLDNGLVIPDYDDSDDDAAADLQKMLGTSRQAAIQYAIVVPYDVGLLKTASMLLRNEGF